MNIVHLTAGTGSFYCGTCIRDNALVRGLQQAGHDAELWPLYMPIVAEGAVCSETHPILMGGINCYLQQNVPVFRHVPPWMDSVLSSRPLLSLASSQAGKTRPEDTGAMTVSMLRGRSGYQAKEIDRLTRHLSARSQPDVLVLSNSLLVGLARPLQDALKVPVVCTIQGECHFIEAMGEPWASQAWELLSDGLRGCAGRIAVSDFVATRVSDRTGVPLDGFEVVHNGIDLQGYQPTHDPTEPFVLGFLARMYGKKGLAQLAEIFTAIREQRDDIELAVAGTLNEGDERDVESFEQTLRARGLMRHVRMAPNLSPEAKRDFLSQITVFCVPSEKDETFGLYHLEALASRVPVVAPRRGAVPEVLGRTGGALLVDDGDIQGFARAIIDLTDDPERRHQLGQEGYTGVRQHFTHQQMARRELEVLEELLRTMRQGAPPLDSGSSRAFT